MNEIGSKLCKICLNSNTEIGQLNNPYLDKFFSHVLGIHEPPLRTWLCSWCVVTLTKIVKLVRLAEESNSYLSHVKVHNEEYRPCNYSLSFHHNEHTDIPPKTTKATRKTKAKQKYKNKKYLKQIDEKKLHIKTKVKEERVESENDIEDFKVEAMDMDVIDENYEDEIEEKVKMGEKDESDAKDEMNDKLEIDILGRPLRKVNPKLYAKCEQYNFTLKLLTIEEQKAEIEEKKKSLQYLKRKYKCDFCGIGFVTEDVYKEHNSRHEESHSRHECPLCHLRFSSALVLSQHALAHARRFTCRVCGAAASRYSDCGQHRRKCPRPTPGVCPHCNKIFTNQNSLDNHVRGVHYEKEKKFVCSYCNQRFQTKQRLAIHTRTHTGVKPYTCDICQRSFAANSNLRNHLAAHAQARPHYCVECDKSYKTRKGLRRHLLEGAPHAGRTTHSCHHCLKSFTSEKLLASHISSAHERDSDSCVLCQKAFSSTANLKKNIRSVREASIV